MRDGRSVCRVLVEKPEGKRPFLRPRRRWEDKYKNGFSRSGMQSRGLHRSGSGQGQVVGACECGNEPSDSVKCGEFLEQLGICQHLKKVSASWNKGKGKGKVHPRTGYEGPEGKQRYSSTLSLTSALDVDGLSRPRPGRFTTGKDKVPILQEAWVCLFVCTALLDVTPYVCQAEKPAASTLTSNRRIETCSFENSGNVCQPTVQITTHNR